MGLLMMKNVLKGQIIVLASLLTALTITLAACGGGSSSAGGGGGGSGSTLSGTVNDGVAVNNQSGSKQLLAAITDIMIRNAHAGVPGIEVGLYKDGTLVDTQFTDNGGKFVFTGLEPGMYSVMLKQDGVLVVESPPIQVAANTKTKVEFSVNAGVAKIEIEAEGDQLAGKVEDNNSNDLTDSDDQSSDLDSDDDQSSDDQSSDLDSDDQNSGNV